MGYRLIYGPTQDKHTRQKKKWPFLGMVCIFFALFCVLAQHFLRQEIAMLYQILFPNAPIEALVRRLQDGENIAESVAAFCEDMLRGN